jgi:hypothetical protein
MTLSVDTATRCSCGSPVRITDGPGYAGRAYSALCPDCYDGTDDSGERAHVRGWGDSIDEALWSWQDSHDAAHEVEWCLTDLFGEISRQLSEEHDRQDGWVASLAVRMPDDGAAPTVPMAFYGPEQTL